MERGECDNQRGFAWERMRYWESVFERGEDEWDNVTVKVECRERGNYTLSNGFWEMG